MFLFVQALVGQILEMFINKTCQLLFYSLNILIGNTLKLYFVTKTDSLSFTDFLLKYCTSL